MQRGEPHRLGRLHVPFARTRRGAVVLVAASLTMLLLVVLVGWGALLLAAGGAHGQPPSHQPQSQGHSRATPTPDTVLITVEFVYSHAYVPTVYRHTFTDAGTVDRLHTILNEAPDAAPGTARLQPDCSTLPPAYDRCGGFSPPQATPCERQW